MNKRILDRYFRKLRRKLPLGRIEKQKILSDLRINTENWTEAHPDADEAAFLETFGTPDAVAKSYIEQMDPAEISKKFQIRKSLLSITLVLAAIILLIWLIWIIVAMIDVHVFAHGQLATYPAIVIE